MYALLVATVLTALALLYGQLAGQAERIAQVYRLQSSVAETSTVAVAVDGFYREVGKMPASLDELRNAPGYAHVRGAAGRWITYLRTGDLDDGTWLYRRAVVAMRAPAGGTSVLGFLQANACGTGTSADAVDWCGDASGAWYRLDDRQGRLLEIAEQRARQHRMLQKWADFYSANGTFPGSDSAGVPLPPGEAVQLRVLANYAGEASGCSGIYAYAGIPVECGEMFDRWGGPVIYQYMSPGHIVVVSQAPFRRADGGQPFVATDFEVQL